MAEKCHPVVLALFDLRSLTHQLTVTVCPSLIALVGPYLWLFGELDESETEAI